MHRAAGRGQKPWPGTGRPGHGRVADGGLVRQPAPGPARSRPGAVHRCDRRRPGRRTGTQAGQRTSAGGARQRPGLRAAALPERPDRPRASPVPGPPDRVQLPGPVHHHRARRQHRATNQQQPAPATETVAWRPAQPRGTAEDSTLAEYVLEASGLVHDLPGGPQLQLTLTWAGQLLDEPDVTELAHLWAATLTGLATHATQPDAGGLTPSDLTITGISQEDISGLEAMWKTRQG